MTKVLAVKYTRKSDPRQSAYSIIAQSERIDDYAKEHGFKIVDSYHDDETSRRPGRSDFEKMRQFLSEQQEVEGGCRVILVEKTDRLYRNYHDRCALDLLDIERHFVMEGNIIRPNSSSSELLSHNVQLLVANHHTNNLVEEVTKGIRACVRSGKPTQVPKGYRSVRFSKKNRIIEWHPDEADVVKKIFTLYATGNHSYRSLSEMASKHGVSISPNAVGCILTNPYYYGEFRSKHADSKRGVIQGSYDPLITRSLYDKVQLVLESKRHHRTGVGKSKMESVYQGCFICGDCGSSVTPEPLKKGRYKYYHCANRNCSYRTSIEETYITKQVISRLCNVLIPHQFSAWLEYSVGTVVCDERRILENAISKNSRRLTLLDKKLNRLYDDYTEDIISVDEFKRLKENACLEKSEVERELAEMNDSILSLEPSVLSEETFMHLPDIFRNEIPELKRKIYQLIFNKSPLLNKKITFRLRKPFDAIFPGMA